MVANDGNGSDNGWYMGMGHNQASEKGGSIHIPTVGRTIWSFLNVGTPTNHSLLNRFASIHWQISGIPLVAKLLLMIVTFFQRNYVCLSYQPLTPLCLTLYSSISTVFPSRCLLWFLMLAIDDNLCLIHHWEPLMKPSKCFSLFVFVSCYQALWSKSTQCILVLHVTLLVFPLAKLFDVEKSNKHLNDSMVRLGRNDFTMAEAIPKESNCLDISVGVNFRGRSISRARNY